MNLRSQTIIRLSPNLQTRLISRMEPFTATKQTLRSRDLVTRSASHAIINRIRPVSSATTRTGGWARAGRSRTATGLKTVRTRAIHPVPRYGSMMLGIAGDLYRTATAATSRPT